jgi:hypothetical protein
MFCPNCKVEYRRGFRECSDCHVPLVEYLPTDDTSSAEADPDAMDILWSGTDPRFAETLVEALDRADLQPNDEAVKLGVLPAFPGAVRKISVRSADRDAADRVLRDVIDGNTTASETTATELARDAATVNPLSLNRRVFNRVPGSETSSGEEEKLADPESADSPTPNDVVENFDPEEATCEVWSGEDSKLATYLNDCMRGVGIGCVVVPDGTNVRVLVLPAAEKRAREVVREVVEGTPPE